MIWKQQILQKRSDKSQINSKDSLCNLKKAKWQPYFRSKVQFKLKTYLQKSYRAKFPKAVQTKD